MPQPVALLTFDSRSWGPIYCERCDREIEEVVLLSDASFACPDCHSSVEGLDQVTNLFVSATPYPRS